MAGVVFDALVPSHVCEYLEIPHLRRVALDVETPSDIQLFERWSVRTFLILTSTRGLVGILRGIGQTFIKLAKGIRRVNNEEGHRLFLHNQLFLR